MKGKKSAEGYKIEILYAVKREQGIRRDDLAFLVYTPGINSFGGVYDLVGALIDEGRLVYRWKGGVRHVFTADETGRASLARLFPERKSSPEVERLVSELDVNEPMFWEPRVTLLSVLADTLEDLGDFRVAGLRLLLKQGLQALFKGSFHKNDERTPGAPPGPWWAWGKSDLEGQFGRELGSVDAEWRLFPKVYDLLPRDTMLWEADNYVGYATRSGAYLALAEAAYFALEGR